MTRADLIERIHKSNPGLTTSQVEKAVLLIFEEIANTLANGGRIELRGFGVFTVRKRDSRTGRNPRTGENVPVEEKYVPFFKAGKLLWERINGLA